MLDESHKRLDCRPAGVGDKLRDPGKEAVAGSGGMAPAAVLSINET